MRRRDDRGPLLSSVALVTLATVATALLAFIGLQALPDDALSNISGRPGPRRTIDVTLAPVPPSTKKATPSGSPGSPTPGSTGTSTGGRVRTGSSSGATGTDTFPTTGTSTAPATAGTGSTPAASTAPKPKPSPSPTPSPTPSCKKKHCPSHPAAPTSDGMTTQAVVDGPRRHAPAYGGRGNGPKGLHRGW